MTISLAQPFEDLTFLSPLSQRRADELVQFVTAGHPATVLDVGCGWAELLLQVVAGDPGVHGIGVDINPTWIEHARQQAEQRGLSARLTLICGDGTQQLPQSPDAVLCIGSSQIWGPPVEENQPLDYAGALAAVRALVPRGARVVYGEGIWSSPPTAAAVAPLSGRLDELITLPELIDVAVRHGFMPLAVHEADLDEWDHFESGFGARYARWLAEHGTDSADAAEVHARASQQRDGYFHGYRAVMGMAYLALLAV